MRSLFRPVLLFKNNFVDLSLLAVSSFFLLLLIFILLSSELFSPSFLLLGAGIGFSIGILVIGWEVILHRQQKIKDLFRPSFLLPNISALFILAMYLFRNDSSLLICTFMAAFCYQLSLLVGILMVERKTNKRYRWIELFPASK